MDDQISKEPLYVGEPFHVRAKIMVNRMARNNLAPELKEALALEGHRN